MAGVLGQVVPDRVEVELIPVFVTTLHQELVVHHVLEQTQKLVIPAYVQHQEHGVIGQVTCGFGTRLRHVLTQHHKMVVNNVQALAERHAPMETVQSMEIGPLKDNVVEHVQEVLVQELVLNLHNLVVNSAQDQDLKAVIKILVAVMTLCVQFSNPQ